MTTPRRRSEPPERTADLIILWDSHDERPRSVPADSKEEAEAIATEVRRAVYYLRRWGGPDYRGMQCRPYVEPAEGGRKPWRAVFMVHRPFFPTA